MTSYVVTGYELTRYQPRGVRLLNTAEAGPLIALPALIHNVYPGWVTGCGTGQHKTWCG